MLDWQIDYIKKYREEVKALAKGHPTLPEEAIAELVERMQAYLPGERLNFLIPMGANTVATELANEQNKIGAKQP